MPKLRLFRGVSTLPHTRHLIQMLAYSCVVVVALMFASRAAAIADKGYTISIVNDSGSPVMLTKCEVWARDWNKTIELAHASVPNALLDVGVAYSNTSSKTVTAIRVKLTLYDALDTLLRAGTDDSTSNRSADKMSVGPGSSFDLLGPRS